MTSRTLSLVTAVSIFWTAVLWMMHDPGTFNIDEVHYLLAAKSFVETGSFTIPNGFSEFRSSLLLFLHPATLKELPNQTEMTAFIPPYYCAVAAPFYLVTGLAGLFLLTALSYIVSLVVVSAVAAKTSLQPNRAAWIALVVAIGGTYWADYGVAVISHGLNMALSLGALAIHPLLARDETGRKPLIGHAILCGTMAGIATGVRYQSIVTAFGLGVFMLAAHPAAVRRALAFLAGFLPWMIGLSLINMARFGDPFPFSYGITSNWQSASVLSVFVRNFALFIALLGILAGVTAFAYGKTLKRWNTLSDTKRRTILRRSVAAACTLPVLLLVFSSFRTHLLERFLGVWIWPQSGPWLDTGLLTFHTGVRRAWLQSFPLAPACLLAPLVAVRCQYFRKTPGVLLAGALLWLHTMFALLLHNNGGFFFNQRYLLDATLFGVIVFAATVAPAIDKTALPKLGVGTGVGIGLVAFYLIVVKKGGPTTPVETIVDRGLLPLIALTLLFTGCMAAVLKKHRNGFRTGFLISLPAAAMLPLAIHLWTDIEASHEYRATRRAAYERLLKVVPDKSLLIVYGGQREPAGRLKETRDVWVADAHRTNWEGVPELIQQVHGTGSRDRVFIAPAGEIPPDLLREVVTTGTRILEKPFALYELPKTAGSAGP